MKLKKGAGYIEHCKKQEVFLKDIVIHYLPTVSVTVISLFFFAPLFVYSSLPTFVSVPLAIASVLLASFLSYIIFPRIVVTIKDEEHTNKGVAFTLWLDGKEIFERNNKKQLPVQINFQVWRRGIYQLCLYLGKNSNTRSK